MTAATAPGATSTAPAGAVLAATGISKRFGSVQALDDVSLAVSRGEVHALLGENGAGKSTLVAILGGTLHADAGSIELDGAVLAPRRRPDVGRRIATVHQDLMLIPSMTGLQNIALALGMPLSRAARHEITAVQERFGIAARLDVNVRELGLPEQQRVELLRALCQEPSVLLLDEPTSYLPPTAVQPFLRGVRRLTDTGISVVFITHRLDELRGLADRVTVLRRGRVVATHAGALPTSAELAVAMVGTSVVQPEQTALTSTGVVMEANGVSVAGSSRDVAVKSVSLVLRPSEIVGIAGVDGNGQTELLEALAGLRRITGGSLTHLGEDVTGLGYVERSKRGVHFVSGDRRRYGIVPTFTIRQHFQYVLGSAIAPRIPRLLEEFDVHPPDQFVRGDQLSGGNQQKLMLARACERQPRLLILTYPTSGLDVRASVNVRELLLRAASRGAAIVVASSELDELQTICHRIVVMSRGEIVGEQHLGHFDAVQLGRWFTGDTNKEL